MTYFEYEKNRTILNNLMKQVSINNQEELGAIAGISQLQIKRLEYGLIDKMSVETIVKLAAALQISVEQLITNFTNLAESQAETSLASNQDESSQFLSQEYEKLQQEMAQQAKVLENQFQQASIQTIESWLIQWPTAVAAIMKNPELPAERLIPLVKPVKQLVEQWGIETIAIVGQELPYDPQWHELMKGSVEPGAMVKVRYVGYQQKDKILYKAKVSPLEES